MRTDEKFKKLDVLPSFKFTNEYFFSMIWPGTKNFVVSKIC